MKKFRAILLWAFCILGFLNFYCSALFAANILLPETSVENSASSFTIPLSFTVPDGENVSSLEFEIHFDNAALQYSGTSLTANLVASEKIVESRIVSDGIVKLLIYGANNTVIKSGDLVSVEFTCVDLIANSQVDVHIRGCIVSTMNGSATTCTAKNDPIHVGSGGPSIDITFPGNGSVISRTSTLVRGTVDDAMISTIIVSVDNINAVTEYTVTPNNGAFETSVELISGTNILNAKGVNSDGQMAMDEVVCDVDLTVLGVPQFLNEDVLIASSDFTLQWTDESESGAEKYEVILGNAAADFVINNYNVVSSYSDAKIGTGSLWFNGIDSYLEVAETSNWNIFDTITDDSSIDFWLKFDYAPTSHKVIAQQGIDSEIWQLTYSPDQGFSVVAGSNNGLVFYTGTGGVINDTDWHHLAIIKNRNIVALYLDGHQTHYVEYEKPCTANGNLLLGRNGTGYFFNGSIDEFRIINCNAFDAQPNSEKSDSITVPAIAYQATSDTVLLLHSESDEVTDSSQSETFITANTSILQNDMNDGVYQYVVRALGGDNAYSEYSNSLEITVDTRAPECPSMQDLESTTNNTYVSLRGGCSLDTSEVHINAGSATISEVTYPEPMTWEAVASFDNDGTYTISVSALDETGNESEAVTRGITIDTTKPNIDFITNSVGGQRVGAGTSVTVLMNGESGCDAYFRVNKVTAFQEMKEIADGQYQGIYTVQPNDDVVGAFVTGKLIDGAKNESEIKSDVTFTIDTTPPNITLITNDVNGVTCKPDDSIGVTLYGDSGHNALFSIDGIANDILLVEEAIGVYTGSYTVQKGDDVTNVLILGKLIDDIGNSMTMQSITDITIDTIAPVINVTSHENGAVITARSITIEGTVDDATTDTVVIADQTFSVLNGKFSVNIDSVIEGVNVFTISAMDAVGNIGSVNFSVKLVFPPEVPAFTSPDAFINTPDFSLEWTDESTSGAASYEVVLGNAGGSFAINEVGNLAISENSKWGAGALYLNGVDSYLEIEESFDWSIFDNLSDNKSMEFWLKFDSLPITHEVIAQQGTGGEIWQLTYSPNQGFSIIACANSGLAFYTGESGEINDLEWHHVFIAKFGNIVALYLDGKQVSYTEFSTPCATYGNLLIGRNETGFFFQGSLDEYRIVNAKIFNAQPNKDKTNSIAIPNGAHKTSEDTKLLLHFDGAHVMDSSSFETFTSTTNFLMQNDMPDGTYAYKVRAFTEEGIASEYSDTYEITIDSTPPVVPTIALLDELICDTSFTLSGTKSSDTEEIIVEGGSATIGDLAYPSLTTWECTVNLADDGDYEFSVVATDKAGNISNAAFASTTLDTIAPVITVTSPTSGLKTPQKSVTFTGSLDDSEVTMATVVVTNGSGVQTHEIVIANGDFGFDYSLTKGLNTFAISAIDAAGNVGTEQVQVSFSNPLPLVFVPIDNQAAGYDETISFTVRIVDQALIHPELLSISASNLPGAGAGNPATFDPTTGLFTWTPMEDQVGLYTNIVFTAQDDNKYTTETIKIVVQSYDLESDDFNKIMGNGKSSQVIVEDFNNDGYKDIYMVNEGTNKYLINNQDETFTEAAVANGCDDAGNGVSATVLDVDKDGWYDIYVVNEGDNVYYHNNGDGSFTDETIEAGLSNSENGVAAYANDFNKDGNVDLLILNKNSIAFYRSNGAGVFVDKTIESGLVNIETAEMACVTDIDSDCDLDIYIVNSGENKLYENNGNAFFEDITAASGVGNEESNCTTKIYDFDYDGDNDIVIYNHYSDIYYSNNGDTTFSRALFSKTYDPDVDGKYSLFFDYDKDGDLDILIVDKNSRFVDGLGNILYANNNDGSFDDVTAVANLL